MHRTITSGAKDTIQLQRLSSSDPLKISEDRDKRGSFCIGGDDFISRREILENTANLPERIDFTTNSCWAVKLNDPSRSNDPVKSNGPVKSSDPSRSKDPSRSTTPSLSTHVLPTAKTETQHNCSPHPMSIVSKLEDLTSRTL